MTSTIILKTRIGAQIINSDTDRVKQVALHHDVNASPRYRREPSNIRETSLWRTLFARAIIPKACIGAQKINPETCRF